MRIWAHSSQTGASQRIETNADRGETAGSGQAGERESIASWHPIPVRLVDTMMPRLKDTELRVLLVVLRQT